MQLLAAVLPTSIRVLTLADGLAGAASASADMLVHHILFLVHWTSRSCMPEVCHLHQLGLVHGREIPLVVLAKDDCELWMY